MKPIPIEERDYVNDAQRCQCLVCEWSIGARVELKCKKINIKENIGSKNKVTKNKHRESIAAFREAENNGMVCATDGNIIAYENHLQVLNELGYSDPTFAKIFKV